MVERADRVYRNDNYQVLIAPDSSEFLMPTCADEKTYIKKGYRVVTPEMLELQPQLQNGAWAGKRCFIVGGGPSLKGFDWSHLDGELSIGINRAIEYYDPTVSFSIDSRWFEWTIAGRLGFNAKQRYETFTGHKVQLCADGHKYPEYVQVVYPYPNPRAISTNLQHGIGHGDNSGTAAINLAICLGATEIYLLGFDCQVKEGPQEHFHDGYPVMQRAKVYSKFIASNNIIAPLCVEHARVINCNPDSGIRCFEFAPPPWGWPENDISDTIPVTEHESQPVRPAVQVYQEVEDGMWQDEPCVIIGGGSSLEGFNWADLQGLHTIALNRAFEKVKPSIIFATDHRFYNWVYFGDVGGKWTRERFEAMECPKILGGAVSQMAGHYNNTGEVKTIMANEPRKDDMAGDLTTSIKDGLLRSTNSGIPALNLALNLGANPIYLLGFDCQSAANGNEHFHNGYPDDKPQPFASHIAGFDRIAEAAKARARIVNCSNWSALTCFEFGKLPVYKPESIPVRTDTQKTARIKKRVANSPIFVSYYTEPYRTHAEALRASLDAHGCEHDIELVDSAGSWEKNCAMKPEFVRRMRQKHRGRRIVWLDADAVVQQSPELLSKLNGADFAAHTLAGELLSGTLYFAPTSRATRLVTRWNKEQGKTPTDWDQRTLARALVGWKGEHTNLPPEYCRIFDNRKQKNVVPVIRHMQASRLLKGLAQ